MAGFAGRAQPKAGSSCGNGSGDERCVDAGWVRQRACEGSCYGMGVGPHKRNSSSKKALAAHEDEQALLARLNMSGEEGHTSLKALAMLGGKGRYPGNVHRDLVAYLGEPNIPAAFIALIHVRISKPRRFQRNVMPVSLPFLPPHIYFAHLFKEHPREV